MPQQRLGSILILIKVNVERSHKADDT